MRDKEFYQNATEQEINEILSDIDVNDHDKDGLTPLHWVAACNANTNLIRILIDAGSDIGSRSQTGFTALHGAAAYNSSPMIIQELIKHKASVNARNDNGLTPLHGAAAFNKNPEIINELVNSSARIDSITNKSVTPIFAAASYNENASIIQKLVALGSKVDEKNDNGETPLHMAAAFNRNPQICTTLIELGADVNATDNKNMSPLHFATMNNSNNRVISVLLMRGADKKLESTNGKTAFDFATAETRSHFHLDRDVSLEPLDPKLWGTNNFFSKATPEDVLNCLNEGADANKIEKAQGLSPLSRAARYTKYREVIEILIQSGADIHVMDDKQNTPLHWATKNKNIPTEIIEILIAHGAEITARNLSNVLPIEMAARNTSDSNVLNLFITSGINLDDGENTVALIRSTLANSRYRRQLIQVLLKNKLNMNAQDNEGNTALHLLAQSKSWSSHTAIASLLEFGADKTIENNQGKPPKELATRRNLKLFQETENDLDIDQDENDADVKVADIKGDVKVADIKGDDISENSDGDVSDADPNTDVADANDPPKKTRQANWGSKNFFLNATLADIQQKLEEGSDPNIPKRSNTAPIMSASRYANTVAIVELLISHHANTNVRDNNKETPLHWAARNEHVPGEIIKLLVAHKADISARSIHDNSPIFTATRHSFHVSAVISLLESGADIRDKKGKDGETLLHSALNNTHCAREIIDVLLKNGIDVNVRNSLGNTALHIAARTKKLESVRHLLSLGADPSIENNKRETPLDTIFGRTREIYESILAEIVPDKDINPDENPIEPNENEKSVAELPYDKTQTVHIEDSSNSDDSSENKDA